MGLCSAAAAAAAAEKRRRLPLPPTGAAVSFLTRGPTNRPGTPAFLRVRLPLPLSCAHNCHPIRPQGTTELPGFFLKQNQSQPGVNRVPDCFLLSQSY